MPLSGPETIDVSEFLKDKTSTASLESCKRLAQTLKETSCLIIRDPRVSEEDNNTFLTMMEQYYEQELNEKMKDVHPELHYQLGATPEFVEVPRDHADVIKKLAENPANAAQVPKVTTINDSDKRLYWRCLYRSRLNK
jgi:hypothetical protein